MKKTSVVVHSGEFHADDVFAVATLAVFLGVELDELDIKRTRDEEVLNSADYVLDVGFVNDGETRFDHHQEGGAGERENGVPYATFGLIWKKFGEKICGNKETADLIEKKIVEPVDAEDNGVDIYKSLFKDVRPFTYPRVIYAMNPTWKEGGENNYEDFLKAVGLTKNILEREIKRAKDFMEGKPIVLQKYNEAKDKRIIILDGEYPYRKILKDFKEPLYVVKKSGVDGNYGVYCVKDDPGSFISRKDLPESWAGKTGEELARITGVKDAVFCHTKRFMCVAGSIEGAVEMAKIAVNN